MKIRYITKKLVLCYPKKNTIDLNATSTSELFSVGTTDDEEQVVTKYPIDTAKPSPSATAAIETSKPSPIASVHVVDKISSVYIVTREPIDKIKTPFQPVTTTFLPSSKVPANLSSIYEPSKPSPVTTYYIITRYDIFGQYFMNDMCCPYPYNILANKCLDMDKAFHTYFMCKVKLFFMKCYELQNLSICYIFFLTHYSFFQVVQVI